MPRKGLISAQDSSTPKKFVDENHVMTLESNEVSFGIRN